MTHIVAQRGDRIHRLRAVGHASGSREVCGAVSVLLQGLWQWALDHDSLVSATAGMGYADLAVHRTGEWEYDFVCYVLRLLARDCPEYVTYEEV